jgi:hypothetical protein
MKRIIMLSTLAATMAVMLALVGSASAAEPMIERERFQFEETGNFIADCGAFQVLNDFVAEGQTITFSDSAGNQDYSKVHILFHDFFYSSETGEGFAETNSVSVVLDASGGEVTASGLSYHVTVPGEGLVLLDAGRLKFDESGEVVFEAGPHQARSGDTDKLCDAFVADS